MSTRVDVLAVMDSAARDYELQSEDAKRLSQPGTAEVFEQAVKEVLKARTAVAELIQVLTEARDVYLPKPTGINVKRLAKQVEFNDRVDSVLARVGGAA